MPETSSPRRPAAPGPGSASEIAPGVYVGGWHDAPAFEGRRFCVLDEAPDDLPSVTHIAIYDERTGRANRANLDRLAGAIAEARRSGAPVLVFCGHGVRRAPLGAAWYLHRTERIPLDAAYARIRAVRPKIEPARSWLPDPSCLDGA